LADFLGFRIDFVVALLPAFPLPLAFAEAFPVEVFAFRFAGFFEGVFGAGFFGAFFGFFELAFFDFFFAISACFRGNKLAA
jgi:hypothetical protein